MHVDQLAAEMIDREAIRHVMMRYARAIDRVDEALLRSVYWPDATDNHGNYNGPVDGFIEWVIPGLGAMDQTMHMLGNIHIELYATAAAVESYFHAYHRMVRDDGSRFDAVIAGRYVDRMEKRAGEWRIRHRTCLSDWSRLEPSVAWRADPVRSRLAGKRKPDDLLYSAGRLGIAAE